MSDYQQSGFFSDPIPNRDNVKNNKNHIQSDNLQESVRYMKEGVNTPTTKKEKFFKIFT